MSSSQDLTAAPETVTRAMAARLLYEAAGKPEGPMDTPFPDVSGGELERFPDAGGLAPWAQAPLLWCVKTGLLHGRANGTLPPKDPITMAEAVVILRRAAALPDMGRLKADLEKETIPVRVMDPALAVDDMDRALGQVGGGYLLCRLSRDGTAITVTPQGGLPHKEALARLAEVDVLAGGAPELRDGWHESGRAAFGFLYFHVDADGLTRHSWDRDWTDRLTAALT